MKIHSRQFVCVCSTGFRAAGSNDLVPKAFGYLFIFPSARPPARPPCHAIWQWPCFITDLTLCCCCCWTLSHTLTRGARGPTSISSANFLGSTYCVCQLCAARPTQKETESQKAAPNTCILRLASDLFHTHASGLDDWQWRVSAYCSVCPTHSD